MRRVRFVVGAAAVAASTLVAAAARVGAQSSDPPKVDPDATAALQKMGAYLRTLSAFQVHATVSTEDVLDAPLALIGSVDEIAETLIERRERYGLSYVVVMETVMDAFAPVVQRLAAH